MSECNECNVLSLLYDINRINSLDYSYRCIYIFLKLVMVNVHICLILMHVVSRRNYMIWIAFIV